MYRYATQALGSVRSANCITVFCKTSARAQTPSPLFEDSRHAPPSLQPIGERFLLTITATMEKMSSNASSTATGECLSLMAPLRDIHYSDRGSTRWWNRNVLDERTRMARLLQFPEVPDLGTVQRYEVVLVSLEKSLEILQNRFGRPLKIVTAYIDALT